MCGAWSELRFSGRVTLKGLGESALRFKDISVVSGRMRERQHFICVCVSACVCVLIYTYLVVIKGLHSTLITSICVLIS